MDLFDKIRRTATALGWLDTLLYGTARGLERLTGGCVRLVKYRFVAQPVAAPTVANLARAGRFDIDWAAPGCPLFAQFDRPAHVLAARFAQGARCLVATAGPGRAAGFLWFVAGPYDEDEVRVKFVPVPAGTACWDFDVSILPDFRMGRLFGLLWARACAELSSTGIRWTVSRISAFNGASLASHRRLGARSVGSAVFLCAGRFQLMGSTLRPKLHLSWREAQRPVLEVGA